MKIHDEQLVPPYEVLKFKNFIMIENNNDIIFSAPFGTGKTYFLKEIFQSNEQVKECFNFIHLFPVNYSISSNDDIFDLIKFDIIIELLKEHRQLIKDENLNFSELLTAQSFLQNKFEPLSFLKDLLHKSELLGKPIFEVFDLFKNEYKKYQQYAEEINKSEEDQLFLYLENLSSKIKVKELDPISDLINRINEKAKVSKKQNVLIIDDLDRIDPEHIFRIFNVFSAHRDYLSKSHKYGFDKIILVCDIENIRKIYEHRYGKEVDFHGYISKFLSTEIYQYNIINYLNKIIDTTFKNINYNINIESFFHKSNYHNALDFSKINNKNNHIYTIFKFYLNYCIDLGLITIRDLSKIDYLDIPNQPIFFKNGDEKNAYDYPILIIVKYLDFILGGKRRFYNEINIKNIKGDHLSFMRSPTLFYDPQRLIISILEEILILKIQPNKDIENNYSIKVDRMDIPGNFMAKDEDLIVNIPYKSSHNWEKREYEIVIDQTNVNWELLMGYNINKLLAITLNDFYKTNPTF